jgi:hypothetical protein
MKLEKEELEKLIFIENKSYREIGRLYNCSDTYIKKLAKSFEIILPKRKKFPDNFVPHNKNKRYSKIFKNEFENKCVVCGNFTRNPKFCSNACQGKKKSCDRYSYYLDNQSNFCKPEYNLSSFKPYILEEQNHRCKICDMPDIWNNTNIVFVLDHIDGNAANNLKENLRLVCPNCDSQLPTFKSKNKNSARKTRYYKNYKNINNL